MVMAEHTGGESSPILFAGNGGDSTVKDFCGVPAREPIWFAGARELWPEFPSIRLSRSRIDEVVCATELRSMDPLEEPLLWFSSESRYWSWYGIGKS